MICFIFPYSFFKSVHARTIFFESILTVTSSYDEICSTVKLRTDFGRLFFPRGPFTLPTRVTSLSADARNVGTTITTIAPTPLPWKLPCFIKTKQTTTEFRQPKVVNFTETRLVRKVKAVVSNSNLPRAIHFFLQNSQRAKFIFSAYTLKIEDEIQANINKKSIRLNIIISVITLLHFYTIKITYTNINKVVVFFTYRYYELYLSLLISNQRLHSFHRISSTTTGILPND